MSRLATPTPRQFFDPYERRFPKVIEGALDLMPAGPPWDAADYAEWLAYFDQACRLYYRIPARLASRRDSPDTETAPNG